MIDYAFRYRLSPDTYIKKIKGITLLFNPLTVNNIVLLESWEKSILPLMNGKRRLSTIIDEMSLKFPKKKREEIDGLINRLISENIVLAGGDKTHVKAPNHKEKQSDHLSFWISLTDQCNFRCKYCFIKKNAPSMNEEGYKKAMNTILRLINKNNPRLIRINYSGGEPLLNVKILKNFHNALQNIGKLKKIEIVETIITNGSLVTGEIINYLKKEQIMTSVSMDGLGEVHNRTRIYADGSGTFSQAEKGLLLLNKNNLLRNVGVVISSQNIDGLSSLIAFLLKNNILFILNFYKYNFLSGNEFYCNQKKLILGLKKVCKQIYRYYMNKNIQTSPLKQLQLLNSVQFEEKRSRSCSAGLGYWTIRVDGTLDICPLLHGNDNKKNGSVFTITPSDITNGCRTCQWRYLCGGGCAAEKWIKHGTTSKTSEYCNVYKKLIPFLIDLEGEFILHNRVRSSFLTKKS